MTAAVLALVAALASAGVIGWLMTRRAGDVRATGSNTADDIDTSDLGLSADGIGAAEHMGDPERRETPLRAAGFRCCSRSPGVAGRLRWSAA